MKTVCICCPIGCNLTIEEKDGEILVSGNTCPRGKEYGKTEYTNPKRVLTTSLVYNKVTYTVKTETSIPKNLVNEAVKKIKKEEYRPLKIGDTLIENILNTGVKVIITGVLENV